MRVVFLRDVGKWRKGDVVDYPKLTLLQIARAANVRLEDLVAPVDDVAKQAVDPERRPARRR
jgi:hypothetical protein